MGKGKGNGKKQSEPTALVVSTEPTSLGNCPVCGEALPVDDVVACIRCATPHHGECWRFSKACSTYGCRCRIYRNLPTVDDEDGQGQQNLSPSTATVAPYVLLSREARDVFVLLAVVAPLLAFLSLSMGYRSLLPYRLQFPVMVAAWSLLVYGTTRSIKSAVAVAATLTGLGFTFIGFFLELAFSAFLFAYFVYLAGSFRFVEANGQRETIEVGLQRYFFGIPVGRLISQCHPKQELKELAIELVPIIGDGGQSAMASLAVRFTNDTRTVLTRGYCANAAAIEDVRARAQAIGAAMGIAVVDSQAPPEITLSMALKHSVSPRWQLVIDMMLVFGGVFAVAPLGLMVGGNLSWLSSVATAAYLLLYLALLVVVIGGRVVLRCTAKDGHLTRDYLFLEQPVTIAVGLVDAVDVVELHLHSVLQEMAHGGGICRHHLYALSKDGRRIFIASDVTDVGSAIEARFMRLTEELASNLDCTVHQFDEDTLPLSPAAIQSIVTAYQRRRLAGETAVDEEGPPVKAADATLTPTSTTTKKKASTKRASKKSSRFSN